MRSLFKFLAIIATVLMSGSAFAQSAFEGAYGQAGIGYDKNSVKEAIGNDTGENVLVTSASKGSVSGVIGFGYNFVAAKDYLIGVGADYGVVSSSRFDGTNVNATIGQKVSNRYNIFVAPAYVIDKDKLAYFKVGYSNQTVKSTVQGANSVVRDQTIGSGSAKGYVLGLGYKQIINNGFYGFAEANFYNYSGVSTSSQRLTNGAVITNYSPKSSAYQALIGAGYKF